MCLWGQMASQVGAAVEHDLFISFSGDDRQAIEPIVGELRSRRLKVWWCGDIEEQRWDQHIEKNLRASRRVIAFITANAEDSDLDYIFAEIEQARKDRKLIPVIVGGAGKTFAIRGVTARLQCYFFDNLDKVIGTSQFEKLVLVCGGQSRDVPAEPGTQTANADARLEQWFGRIEDQFALRAQNEAFALGLTVAIFENGAFVEVESLARSLAEQLNVAEAQDEEVAERAYPRRRGPLLALLECETAEALHPVLGVSQTVVKFTDPERAIAFIQFAWREFGSRREVLREWLADIAVRASREARTRLGLALGLLAQADFIDVFEQVLRPWLISDTHSCRSVADVALSVAAFDPGAAEAVRKRIELWIGGGSKAERLAAIRLACGFAGAREPGLAIETLRAAAEQAATRHSNSSPPFDLISTMQEAMQALLQMHLDNADNSLFDLAGLIGKLAQWAMEDSDVRTPEAKRVQENPYPLYLFLLALEGLPVPRLAKVRGGLSLEALMEREDTARQTAKVFNKALERPRIGMVETRRIAQDILRRWIATRRRDRDDGIPDRDPDPLLILGRCLVMTAPSANDEDRVIHLLDAIFSEAVLRGT